MLLLRLRGGENSSNELVLLPLPCLLFSISNEKELLRLRESCSLNRSVRDFLAGEDNQTLSEPTSSVLSLLRDLDLFKSSPLLVALLIDGGGCTITADDELHKKHDNDECLPSCAFFSSKK